MLQAKSSAVVWMTCTPQDSVDSGLVFRPVLFHHYAVYCADIVILKKVIKFNESGVVKVFNLDHIVPLF